MGKKLTAWRTKGMNRDMSVSVFNPEFAFENRNLRLSTNESNTALSWVNEKGTSNMVLTINESPWSVLPPVATNTMYGTPIGTAVLNHKLIVFTVDADSETPDHIYVLWQGITEALDGKLLYKGNLGFSTDNPLETLVSYETEKIQKVYWTDGLNQPRVINIEASKEKLALWNHVNEPEHGYDVQDTFFDFVPIVDTESESLAVVKHSSGGFFSQGVLQYCFAYFNKNGQQTNIVDVSPLYYLSFTDRAASPEENVSNSFTINIGGIDQSFDYVRLYSIQRTSLNMETLVKIVEDIPITSDTISYTDTGTSGSQIDPTTLLFVGGKDITVLTMADKDGTLFMGNITDRSGEVVDIQEYFDTLRGENQSAVAIDFYNTENEGGKVITFDKSKGYYAHTNQLNQSSRDIAYFKGGETYRFGFQLQKKTGEWTDPILLGNAKNTCYPNVSMLQDRAVLPIAEATLDFGALDLSSYKRIRPMVVFPSVVERSVLCQGVINPTVFNVEDRPDNSPYAQASWYFRPYMHPDVDSSGSYTVPDINYIVRETYSSQSLNPDAPFDGQDMSTAMYVLVVNVKSAYVDDLLGRNSYINIRKADLQGDYVYRHMFTGAIKLDNSSNPKYAFISKSEWPTPHNNGDTDLAEYVDDRIQVDNVNNTLEVPNGSQCLVYSKLNVIDMLYTYERPNGTDQMPGYNTYTLKFKTYRMDDQVDYYYEVPFNSTNESGYNIQNNKSGSAVPFKHYESLVQQGDNPPEEWQKSCEIQGSIKKYDNAFSTSILRVDSDLDGDDDTDITSNTQFFVDQSIVTVNSPDIEFDSTVQCRDLKDLKLRIVGVIPITGTISSHRIQTSSAMLETNYNNPSPNAVYIFGSGEKDINSAHRNLDQNAGKRLVAELLWNDSYVFEKDSDTGEAKTAPKLVDFMIYPWHRTGSLNNDFMEKITASSVLETKKESNLLYSINTEYLDTDISFDVSSKIALTQNAEVMNYRLSKQTDYTADINYYPNIDKVLHNVHGYKCLTKAPSDIDPRDYPEKKVTNPVQMKYLSTSHIVSAMVSDNEHGNIVPVMPYGHTGESTDVGKLSQSELGGTTFWGASMKFSQAEIDLTNVDSKDYNFLWLGEMYREVNEGTIFGGFSKDALKANNWIVGGEAVNLSEMENNTIPLRWTDGDTYYQRYDCLKTYAFTREDYNQIVEILSFMCETHVNIDGRYDRQRGQIKNYMMSPEIFNKINPVYSQQNNFFPWKVSHVDKNASSSFPNQITFSLTKHSGSDVDPWTNVTLASTLELDGDKGELTKIERLNNQLLAFQDSGIAQILYNENVQISSMEGVPIEIANSGKVQGKRYYSDTVGCSNKWSLVTTPSGIYFMDSINKSIYNFNGQLTNVSTQAGFNAWCKQNIPAGNIKWTPDKFENFTACYDKQNQEVLFINADEALAFSEKHAAFTSFYDYGKTPYFVNLDDAGLWINQENSTGQYKVWKHHSGDYCKFFGVNKPYSMTLIGCPEPTTDKIFTNLEFRAVVDGEGTQEMKPGEPETIPGYIVVGGDDPEDIPDVPTGRIIPHLPFDYLEAWNEYQHGFSTLSYDISKLRHSLERKFRIWRCDIPRDTAGIPDSRGLARFKAHPFDRMRNPWVYLKLQKNASNNGTLPKAEIHDLIMTYFS